MVFDRRGFIKFMAGASAGIMATPLPWKLLDDVSIWTQNWGWIPSLKPGESTFVPATSKMCPSAVATQVRLVNGRPVRVLPRTDHPLGGGVSAVAAAEVQMLQSPARVNWPLRRAADGAFVRINWSEAMELLAGKITQAKDKTAFISGDETGSTNEVISAFAKSIGSQNVYIMPSEAQAAAKAARLAGIDASFGYDIENSDFVFAVGANLLENWGPAIRNRRIFRDARPHPVKGAQSTMSLMYAGPLQNHTATVADEWLPVLPGTEGILLLFLANQLIAKGTYSFAEDFAKFKELASKFTLEETANRTGLAKERLSALAKSIMSAKAPLVIAGSETGGAGATNILAAFAVNTLLDNINKPGGMVLLPNASPVLPMASSRAELFQKDLTAWLHDDALPELLILHEANPVYALPETTKTAERLAKIPFKVSFSTFFDETASMCDLVLPLPMGLERTDDIFTPYGFGQNIYCVTNQVVPSERPTMTTADALLFINKQLVASGDLSDGLGFNTFTEVIKSKASSLGGNFNTLTKGEALLLDEKAMLYNFYLRPDIIAKNVLPKKQNDTMSLALYGKSNFGTAKTGFPPFNVKTVRADELDGKFMYVLVHPSSAAGFTSGDTVLLSGNNASIQAKVLLSEKIVPGTVAVGTGFGRTALDEFSQNKGGNIMDILSARAESETGLSVWSQAGIVVTKA